MKMRKLISSALALIFALSSLAGCGQSGSSQPASEATSTASAASAVPTEKVELNYYSWEDEDVYLQAVVDAFNASNDHIHVNYTSFPSMDSEYWTKILVMLSAKEDIDIIGVNGINEYTNFFTKGVLAPLSGLISENNFDMSGYGSLTKQFGIEQDDGTTEYYGLPHRSGVYATFVNKTLFEEAGIDVPYDGWTWDEFVDITHQLTKTLPDGRQQWGSAPRGFAWNDPDFGAFLHGQTALDDDFSHFRDGMELLDELLNGEKKSSPDYVELYQNPSQVTAGNFQAGLLACHNLGDWGVTNMKRYEREGTMDESVDWDVVPLPHFSDMPNGTTYGFAVMTGITSYTEKKQEAFEFLSYLCSEEGAKIIASCGTMPGYRSDAVRDAYLNLDTSKNLKAFTDADVLPSAMLSPAATDLQDMIRREAELYLIGEKDLDTMIQDVETQRKEIIERSGTF